MTAGHGGVSFAELGDAVDGGAFGLHAVVDLHDCDPGKVSDGEGIAAFASALVEEIGMVAYGVPQVPLFGLADEKTAGHSLMQFIETSSIVGHFAQATRAVYLDVFSCKRFDPEVVAGFARDWFGAGRVELTVLLRR